jgi:hypothetical protein
MYVHSLQRLRVLGARTLRYNSRTSALDRHIDLSLYVNNSSSESRSLLSRSNGSSDSANIELHTKQN